MMIFHFDRRYQTLFILDLEAPLDFRVYLLETWISDFKSYIFMWLTLTNDWLKVSYFQVWPLGSCLLSAKNWMTLGLGTSLSILKSESCHNSVEQKKMMITRLRNCYAAALFQKNTLQCLRARWRWKSLTGLCIHPWEVVSKWIFYSTVKNSKGFDFRVSSQNGFFWLHSWLTT